MESSIRNKSARRKVIMIGFDGATFDLLRPWAEAGILPTFQRMMTQGAWGPLQSTMPPVTPAAWSSLATGMNQGKHGLFDFFGRQKDSYETYVVNATHRHGATLWQLLSQVDKDVIVFNVPATYPPDKVNGLMVSGLLTPSEAVDASWPPELLNDLKQAVPAFGFYPPGIFSQGEEVKFVQDVLAWDTMTLEATEFLIKQQSWDFLFTVFIGVDIMSHFMWQHMETSGASAPSSDPAVRDTLANAIQTVYKQADSILAKLLEMVDDDTYVVIVSDHGFGPLRNYIHLNTWLAQKGYLFFKRTPWVQLKYLAFRMGLTPLRILEMLRALGLGNQVQQTASTHNDWLKWLVKQTFLHVEDIDWSRTKAFSTGYGAPIFVNRKGREPQGIVASDAEYEALLDQICHDLAAIRHPQTNDLLISEILRPQTLYSGPFADRAPDLLPLSRDWSNQGYGVHDFASNRWFEPSPDRSGTHRMNGIFFLHGPHVQQGKLTEGAALWDIAPTVLALTGVPIPKNMDGKVLSTAFSEELISQLNITYTETVDEQITKPPMPKMSDEEEQAIRDRLAAMGYVG